MLQLLAEAFTDWRRERVASTPEQIKEAISNIGGSVQGIEALPEWLKLGMQVHENERASLMN